MKDIYFCSNNRGRWSRPKPELFGHFLFKNFIPMIYKFETGYSKNLEVTKEKNTVKFTLKEIGKDPLEIQLNGESLYNLIGALHSIQSLIKKGGSNV